jgi:hypothetical protein
MRTGTGGISMPIEELSPGTQRLFFLNSFLNSLSRLGSIGKFLAGVIALIALPFIVLSWVLRAVGWLIGLPFRLLASAGSTTPTSGDSQQPTAPEGPASLSGPERTALVLEHHRRIEDQILSLRCSDHDKAPSVTKELVDDGEMRLSISTCCPAFKEEITRLLPSLSADKNGAS